MILDRTTPCQFFSIIQPRWHDRKVLLATYKVGAHNKIQFTKAPTLPGEYYVSGEVVKECPISSNGKIPVYEVPIGKLEPVETVQDIKNTINEFGW